MQNNQYQLTAQTFNLLIDNIDTDQIIPAQFLTTTTREGLGQYAFYHWRYAADGQEKDQHAFTQLDTTETSILVAGNNFGCGSSREHAPWALLDLGFKVIMSTEIADIFKSNSVKNGLLPIVVSESVINYLEKHPSTNIQIDINAASCFIEGYGEYQFELDSFSRYCLSNNYDQLDYLLSKQLEISQFEAKL